jgi:hypothetical protein
MGGNLPFENLVSILLEGRITEYLAQMEINAHVT